MLVAAGHTVLPFYSLAPSALAGLGTNFRRLHGLAPLESPYHRRTGLAYVAGRCPPGLFPLQGVPLLRDARLITGAPPSRCFPEPALLSCPSLACPDHASEFRSHSRWHCLSRGRLSLLRFLANAYSGFDAMRSWLIVSPQTPGDVAVPCEPSSDLLRICRSS